MRPSRRFVVGAGSVVAIALAVLIALAVMRPSMARGWLTPIGLVAIAVSISSVLASPRELLIALVLGAAPVMGLAADPGGSWLIGPLGVLLLVGGELNAWSWELGDPESVRPGGRRRGMQIAQLAGMGLGASLVVSVAARVALFSGLLAVSLAAAGLAGLAWASLPEGE